MLTDCSIDIDAPATTVWTVFADVERWADWTVSVQRITPLDGPDLLVGSRFEIKQPRMPNLVWEVTAIDHGASWTWTQRSPGGTTLASHQVVAVGSDRTKVHQRIDQRGPVGVTVGVAMRRMTRRYLDLEAHGLKQTSERLHVGAPAA